MKNDITLYLICGRARSGKDTFSNLLKDALLKRKYNPCIMHITEPLYNYAKNYFGWDGNVNNKPRDFLQHMGVEVIQNKHGMKNFLIERLSEDIEILSDYFDTFIISDIRLVHEIEEFRKRYSKVVVIHIERENYNSGLSTKQMEHLTENDLENYHDFDYNFLIDKIDEIEEKVYDVLESR